MLLRVAIENHLSIKDRQEISFVASSLKDAESGLLDNPAVEGERILPAAVIYGANASGKSNVIKALGFMCSAVRDSHNEWNPEGGVPRAPFALDSNCLKAPSVFEADFVTDGVHYVYGFEASDKAFEAEWLDSFPHGRRRKVFRRNKDRFEFGEDLKKPPGGRKQHRQVIPEIISQMTRPNSLFLSAAVQNNHDYMMTIGGFFRSLRIDTDHSVEGYHASLLLADKPIDDRVITFLKKTGTGVIGYKLRKKKIADEQPDPDSSLLRILELFERPAIELGHRARGGQTEYFNLDRESAGTRRLLILLTNAFRALDKGTPIIVDELNASLHTQACEAILALFCRRETNPNGAQILATTHDTNLLTSELLRRDQIWFTEKDEEGATHIYPLTDFRTRETDNREKGYLQGRYGAVPYTGPASDLFPAE